MYGSAVIVQDYPESDKQAKEVDESGEDEGFLLSHIPLFEISYEDGEKLRNQITQKEEEVVLRIKVSEIKEAESVEIDLWYTSVLDLGLKVTDELTALSLSFGNDHG